MSFKLFNIVVVTCTCMPIIEKELRKEIRKFVLSACVASVMCTYMSSMSIQQVN